ncbi:mucin-2-like [Mytilus trossulus]|uniref:mucin-2-like n=1 Tax=Mytilus trossulus TaxID=6551 RepID=UPI0030054D1E
MTIFFLNFFAVQVLTITTTTPSTIPNKTPTTSSTTSSTTITTTTLMPTLIAKPTVKMTKTPTSITKPEVGFCSQTKCDKNNECINATVPGLCYCLIDKGYFCPYVLKPTLVHSSSSTATRIASMKSMNSITPSTTPNKPLKPTPTTTSSKTISTTTPTTKFGTTQIASPSPMRTPLSTSTQITSSSMNRISTTQTSILTENSTASTFSTEPLAVGSCFETKCDVYDTCINTTGPGLCYCVADTAYFCPFIVKAKPTTASQSMTTKITTTQSTRPGTSKSSTLAENKSGK